MKMRVYTGKLTMDERLFVHCYYTVFSRAEMARYLQIPISRVKTYLDNRPYMRMTAKQKKEKYQRILMQRNKSDQFDEFIKANYLDLNYNQIAKAIKKSDTFVFNRISFLGLKIPKEILEQRIKDSYFKKGQIPKNKGKKMPDDVREKIKHTFFEKGHRPHNAKKEGYEVKIWTNEKEYWMIKVPGRKRMMYKHRYLWELHNGAIPKGLNVQFKDGNTLNCVIENLYLIDRSNQIIENFFSPEALAKRFLKMNDEEIAFAKKYAPGLLEAKAASVKLKINLKKLQK